MMPLKIAIRNILRNARRSGLTTTAIAVGVVALLLFGQFVITTVLGFQTNTVRRTGHLSVFRTGYFEFGAGNPGAYSISGYQSVMRLIQSDSVLGPMIAVITPTVTLYGIASNSQIDATKTFMGSGVVPSDHARMRRWDEYHLATIQTDSGLSDSDTSRGVVGVGVARVLGLCRDLKVPHCDAPPLVEGSGGQAPMAVTNVSELTRRDNVAARTTGAGRLDLLAATAGGAPNVVNFVVGRADPQGVKELDDSYIAMHFALAQQLLYGRGEHDAVAIVLQLLRTEDLARAKARLTSLLKSHHLDLEVRDFGELVPFYGQVIGMFGAIFSFVATIMAIIVLFSVINTMSMSVMERTNEIGTVRALGLRRREVRRQFLLEGWLLGVIGATTGVALAFAFSFFVNRAGLHWNPPGQSSPVPLQLSAAGIVPLISSVWIGLVAMSTVAALIPASRAARLPVVDALRHV
jgi:putative ABC transport system permease protein